MGLRGPPPKPPAQKALEGTSRRDRDPQVSASMAKPGRPGTPDGLSGDALAVWTDLVPRLVRLKTLAKTDGGVLEAYCRNIALARQLDKLAVAEPLVDSPQGVKLNPAASEARQIWVVVRGLAVDLGLSYGARSRAPIPQQENAKDPAEDFIFRRKKLHAVE